MNTYMKAQIDNMISTLKIFQSSCELSATKDDGQIDKDEAKALKTINKATERFIKEIESLK